MCSEIFIEGKDYMKDLPEGVVHADRKDVMKNGEPIVGFEVWLKSFRTDYYEKYRLTANCFFDLMIFLKYKRIFIKR